MTEHSSVLSAPREIFFRAGSYAAVLVDADRLRPTELVHDSRVDKLIGKILADGFWRVPILVEATVGAIMDGHHRWTVAQRLGLKRLPAVVLTYNDPRLTLTSWNGETYTPDDVIAAARSGRAMPQKSTRHILEPGVGTVSVALASLM
ncbi:MAG: ParB N-terminal domain-containing protein [Hyphomicrobiaceae bacterium]